MIVKYLSSTQERRSTARLILEALPDWFGIPEAREEYILNSAEGYFAAAYEGGEPVGFICLRSTGADTAEIYVMGVLKEYHRRGVGRALFDAAKRAAAHEGFSFLQVKTVQAGRYPEYDATNRFYISMGFKEFEVFPTLWDENNPCQIYVMALK